MIKTTRRAKTTAAKPAAASPEPVRPAEVKPALPKPVALKPQPMQPVAAKPEPVKPEAVKPAQPQTNRVSLELVKPDAKTVCVAGSFNEWKPEKTPLAPLGNGRWHGDLAVKPGRHEYLFVVDGQWLPDPNAKETVQNPFGGKNSVLVVSA